MKPQIRTVVTKSDMRQFIKLPWSIYKDDPNWVPPLLSDIKASLDPVKNPTLSKIIYTMFLAMKDGKAVGRVYAGIDTNLNEKKKMNMAFFSMFECIKDYEVAEMLLETACLWAKQNGADFICGPCAVTGTDGDENKGLLVDCFDEPPTLMNSYNPSYYMEFIERFGFSKDYDVYAYNIDKTAFQQNPTKAIEYAQKRYDFRVDTLDLKNLDREIESLKYVMDKAMPDDWPDLVPPSLEEVRDIAKRLVSLADPELIPIARHGDEAIGFAIALPDYNEVLIHLNGRITPLGALKYLYYKKRIKCARVFAMFVIPEFRGKGVSYAIYYTAFMNAMKNGFTRGEASTIGETNLRMRADIEGAGAVHNKTYRIYRKELASVSS
ncbi:MAG: GNAT family N-acetyltransferase [Clostridiaceae bacterium]|nr:GNAT family N-acetyltransferase [Clostridiaceae bacterium]